MNKNNQGVSPLVMLVAVGLIALTVGGVVFYFLGNKSGLIKGDDGRVVKYSQNGNQIKLSDKDGSLTIGEGVKIPPDFPKDVPIYSNTKVTSVFSGGDDLATAGYTLESKDNISKISQWYRDEAKKVGWKIFGEDKMGTTMSITFIKNGYTGALTIMTLENGMNNVSFSMGKTPNGAPIATPQDLPAAEQ